MAVTVGVDSYASEAQLVAYAAARGITIANASQSLIRAMDWLELRDWQGRRFNQTQPLCWPRYAGTSIWQDPWRDYPNNGAGIPLRIIDAQLNAALIIDGGEALGGPIAPSVKKIKVGPIEKEFHENGVSVAVFPIIEQLIAPFVGSTGTSYTTYK